MIRRRVSRFIPVGLLALVASNLLRLYTHGNYWHFAVGFLMGLSIVFMIAGLVRQRRGMTR
jgi:hypothetical protein